jgi:hypothetical protein
VKNDATFAEDRHVNWRGAYLSCSAEEIKKRLHEATREGRDILAQLETMREKGDDAKRDVSGLLEFMKWICSQTVVGSGFEARLDLLVAKELTCIDINEYSIDEQNERIDRLVDALKSLPVSRAGKTDAPNLGKLVPEKLIYQEDIVEKDIELKLAESESGNSGYFKVNNPGWNFKKSYFVLMGNSFKKVLFSTFSSAYTKTRFVIQFQEGPNQPWQTLPYHFEWIVDEITACVSEGGSCKVHGDYYWHGASPKKSAEAKIVDINTWGSLSSLNCSDRGSIHEVIYHGVYHDHTWTWKWCDGWKNGNAGWWS